MKSIQSEGFVTPKDYVHYLRFNMLKGRYYRLKCIAFFFCVAVIVIWLLLAGLQTGNKNLWMIAGVILLCIGMFFYTVNNNVKRLCTKSSKVVRATQRTQFGKNGFVFELIFNNPEEEDEFNEILYDEVEMIYLAPHAMYVYIEKRSVVIIPKRNLKIAPIEARAFLEKFVDAQKLCICV